MIGPSSKPRRIGIGGSLTTSLLPHHRAYGSVPRRFGWLNFGFRLQEQGNSHVEQDRSGERHVQRRRTTVVPTAFTAASSLGGKILTDSKLSQFLEPTFAGLPLLPSITSQTTGNPAVKVPQYRWRLAVTEVTTPTNQITAKLAHHTLQR